MQRIDRLITRWISNFNFLMPCVLLGIFTCWSSVVTPTSCFGAGLVPLVMTFGLSVHLLMMLPPQTIITQAARSNAPAHDPTTMAINFQLSAVDWRVRDARRLPVKYVWRCWYNKRTERRETSKYYKRIREIKIEIERERERERAREREREREGGGGQIQTNTDIIYYRESERYTNTYRDRQTDREKAGVRGRDNNKEMRVLVMKSYVVIFTN